MSRAVPSFVVLYGVLVAGGGLVGWLTKGSTASLLSGGTIGVLLVGSGLGMLRGWAFAAKAAQWLVLATIAVMAERLIRTGGIVPAVPVIAAGLGLSYVLFMERAPAEVGGGAGVPKDPPRT